MNLLTCSSYSKEFKILFKKAILRDSLFCYPSLFSSHLMSEIDLSLLLTFRLHTSMKKGLLAYILLTTTLFSSAQIAEMRQIQLLYSSTDSVAALNRDFQSNDSFSNNFEKNNSNTN
jgi:hypothetical protein